MTTPPSPEELAQAHGLPMMRALIDLDLGDPSPQVIAGNPMDLTDTGVVPVTSIIAPWAIITIAAHPGEEERVYHLLRRREDLKGWVLHYAGHYLEEGVMETIAKLKGVSKRKRHHPQPE